MNFLKSKAFIICLIAAIVLTLIPTLIAAFGGVDLLRSVAGTVAKPFSFAGTKIGEAFNGFIDVFTKYDELKEFCMKRCRRERSSDSESEQQEGDEKRDKRFK